MYSSTASRSPPGRRGNRLAPCNGRPARTRGSSGRELLAEVQAFLLVGDARRELAPEREPAAPRAPAVLHRDRRLLRFRQREELARELFDAGLQLRRDAVTDHVEEPGVAARGVDLVGHRTDTRRVRRRATGRSPATVTSSARRAVGGSGRAGSRRPRSSSWSSSTTRHSGCSPWCPTARGTLTIDQPIPFHVSTRRCTTFCRNTVPTATHRVGLGHDTLVRLAPVAPAGFALVTIPQMVPFHRSISVE